MELEPPVIAEEKDPRDQRHKQIQIILFNAGFHNIGEHERIHHQLHQRIDERPEKAQHRTLVSATQVLFHQTEDHLAVLIDFFTNFHRNILSGVCLKTDPIESKAAPHKACA